MLFEDKLTKVVKGQTGEGKCLLLEVELARGISCMLLGDIGMIVHC